MSDLFEEKLFFAQSLGYRTVSSAIKNFGLKEFNLKFGETPRVVKEKRKKISSSRKDPSTYPIEDIAAGGIPLMFDENYLIFPDGRVWTVYNKMFLTFTRKNYKRNRIHYTCILAGRKPYHIAKLVWLHFGDHEKEYYIDVGEMSYKNGDPLDFSIENLIESDH